MPPSFSAKKVKGARRNELARKKQAVELKAVEVENLRIQAQGN